MTNFEIGLKVASILIFLFSVWIGLKKIQASSFTRTAIFLIDTGLSIVAVIKLGWIGIGLALVANTLAAVIWSVRLAMKKENLLTKASTQGNNSVKEVELLYDQLAERHKVFEYIGPIERAHLILLLSQRGRSKDEILDMAPPIAMLQQVHDFQFDAFVPKFDRLLRLWGKSAEETEDLADTLTVATKKSAATMDDMIDALIAFQDPLEDAL
jgi:hypothetical protein